MSGVYPIDSGQILLDGKDISGATSDQISRLGVSRTFQHIRIFERMTVFENVISAMISLEPFSLNELLGQVRKLGQRKKRELKKSMLDKRKHKKKMNQIYNILRKKKKN